MFNEKTKERLRKLENRLKLSDVYKYLSKDVQYMHEEFTYTAILKELQRIDNRINKVEDNARKQLQELKDFLGIETYTPDCTPYLRKKDNTDELS